MKPIIDKLTEYKNAVADAMIRIDLSSQEATLAGLQSQMQAPDFWAEQSRAERVSKQFAAAQKSIHSWHELRNDINDLIELAQSTDIADTQAQSELERELASLTKRYDSVMTTLKLSDEYDQNPAIMQISAGAGGTDAQDWAEMLLAMYKRYCEKNDLSVDLVDISRGEEAGVKSATLEVSGSYAFGKLKSERGVHRLVRISPFNAQNMRQTSFALVDVIPEIDPTTIDIEPKDLRIDVYRSGGHGGQSVNTTDSAVRITHLPTNTVVSIQNERSQLKNKEKAMSILVSRLSELAREQDASSIAELRGKIKSADWGAQIRSYVLAPYKQVKDHRTNYESKDPEAVLNGELEPFIDAYLNHNLSDK